MPFTGLCKEFESAHVPTLAASTQTNMRLSLRQGESITFL